MERSIRRSGRRTSSIETRRVGIAERLRIALTLTLLSRVRRRHRWRVRLVVGALAARWWTLKWLHVRLAWLLVHRSLLVALWRRRILATLLLRRVLVLAAAVLWKRLAVSAVELSVWWRVLATPDRVRWHEGLCLSTHWREDALLGEALAVGAASILRLVESRAADLHAHVLG